ncbi:MAG: flagellin [Burkholderiales bacterium]|nr:flagellin [Burkholderiales bacterium]
MAAYINTNVASLFAQKSLNHSQNQMQVSLQRLSSGLRINSAKDDATGLVAGTNYDAQLRGTNQAIRNANDGISTAQTNDGYHAQITENLQRMRELAVQSGGTLVLANSQEGTALVAENTRILGLAANTGAVVVNSNGGTVTGVGTKATLGTTYTVTGIDTDITAVNTARATYGADMSTFESAINNLQTSSVNIAAAKSRVMDTDYAAESAQLTRNSILQQAGTAMLAQANQLPNSVLTLLR